MEPDTRDCTKCGTPIPFVWWVDTTVTCPLCGTEHEIEYDENFNFDSGEEYPIAIMTEKKGDR